MMNKKLFFILFGILSASVSFLLYKHANPVMQHVDFRLKDNRFLLRGAIRPGDDVVVVAIDYKSIKKIGRWPWSREITGKLVENLSGYYGAKVVALDIVFSEKQNDRADLALAKSISRSGNVVMGYFFREEIGENASGRVPAELERSRIKLLRIAEGTESIPVRELNGIDTNLPLIAASADNFGFFNSFPDADGLYRRSVLVLMFNGELFPSLALEALSSYLGSDIMVDIKKWGIDSLFIGDVRLTPREDGAMSLNYYGPAGTFRTISAEEIINKRLPNDALRGKICLIGATEMGIYDLRPTPFDATFPGVENHATMIANVLEKRFLKYDSITSEIEIACIIALPLLLGALLAFVPGSFAGMGLLAAFTASFALFNYHMFNLFFRDITILYPLVGMALTYMGCEAWRNLVVQRRGRQLKKAFSSYVSPDLVKQIERDPDKLVLGGEQRELTILFSDIRGFTTVSESLTPQELVTLLNEYLTPMTRIVLDEHGTLDKFIGDAVMAIYNAPLDVPEHAAHACSTAIRMLEELKSLNRGFQARGMNAIDIGIGINTGAAVVGNMGADIRFDYTAIGDAVNLASRLEGLNKFYGTHILASEDTRNLVNDERFVFREVDLVRVKGKHKPVVIYELMIENFEILERFKEGLGSYRRQEFEIACGIFTVIADRYGDGPSKLYQARCAEYLETPPGPEWDGIYTAKSK